MNIIDQYVKTLCEGLSCSDQSKQELADEFRDHLKMLKKEYVDRGYSEEIAEKCAVADFGGTKPIQKEWKKLFQPLHAVVQTISWTLFSLYTLFVIQVVIIGKYDRLTTGENGEGVTLVFDWGQSQAPNFVPFYNLYSELLYSFYYIPNRNLFDFTFFSTAFGLIILFVPFGLLIPIILKSHSAIRLFVSVIITGFLIEGTQFILNSGTVNINDMLYYATGALIGFSAQKLKISRHSEKTVRIEA